MHGHIIQDFVQKGIFIVTHKFALPQLFSQEESKKCKKGTIFLTMMQCVIMGDFNIDLLKSDDANTLFNNLTSSFLHHTYFS